MRVEIWSDVVCPWCYIGKRRFEAALAGFAGPDDVEVVYRPFQLDPTAPPGTTMPVAEAYARKFGGAERAAQMIDNVTSIAAGEGLDFRLDRAQRANTRDAHRVLALALAEHGPSVQSDLDERLLQAYFVDGRNVADHDTLAELSVAAGLDGERVRALLDSDEGVEALQATLDLATELGITAVPTFVFDQRWAVPGAQDADTMRRMLERAAHLLAQESDVTSDGGSAGASTGGSNGAFGDEPTNENLRR